MPIASWALLRQIEALRVAMGTAIQFGTIAQGQRDVPDEEVREWIRSQGVACGDKEPAYVITMLDLDRLKQPWGSLIVQMGRRSAQPAQDIGRKRSGADFKNQSDFVITSALLRLLGAHEQFERDVLKALLYYRPLACAGEFNQYEETEVEESVIAEEGKLDGGKRIYQKPAIWTWISRQSENNVERHRIFSNVFGISCLPDKEAKTLSEKLYEMRNQVAHGRAGVTMTLGEYRDAEYHVVRCILHMMEGCKLKYRLHI